MYSFILAAALMGQLGKGDFKVVGPDPAPVVQARPPIEILPSQAPQVSGGVELKPIPSPTRRQAPKQQQPPRVSIPQEAVVEPRRVIVPQMQFYTVPSTPSYIYGSGGTICLPGGS